jgi:hypothetical protein
MTLRDAAYWARGERRPLWVKAPELGGAVKVLPLRASGVVVVYVPSATPYHLVPLGEEVAARIMVS